MSPASAKIRPMASESKGPIRVYKPNPLGGYVVDLGGGVEDHTHPELADAKAFAETVAEQEGRTVIVEE